MQMRCVFEDDKAKIRVIYKEMVGIGVSLCEEDVVDWGKYGNIVSMVAYVISI